MADASGEFLKVYLYILRQQQSMTAELSLTAIADSLYMTERDVVRALKYWQSKHLVRLTFESDESLREIELLPVEAITEADQPVVHSEPAPQIPEPSPVIKAAKPEPVNRQYTMDEICHFCEENNDSHLLLVLQEYMKHPLTQTELNTVLFFHDQLGFSTDLIEYLFEYCASIQHRSIHYIEKVALGWAEAGIRTVTEAKGKSTYFTKHDYAVLKAFGISGRNPVPQEMESIRRWTDQYGFSMPVILEACNRTMSAIHTPSFDYAEKILKNWHDQKLFNLEDIKKADHVRKEAKKSKAESADKQEKTAKGSDAKNRFNRFNQRTYDYESLEQTLSRKLNHTPQ